MPSLLHKNMRRKWHDYSAVATYCISLQRVSDGLSFGIISSKNEVEVSDLGKIAQKAIADVFSADSRTKLHITSLLPDRAVFLASIVEKLDYNLDTIISRIRQKADSALGTTIFADSYSDIIVTERYSLADIFHYLLTLAQHRLPSSPLTCQAQKISIAGQECMAIGNTDLLNNPFKEAVIVHRNDDAYTRNTNEALWHHTAANGGVIVSPFISSAERAIRSLAADIDANIILITPQGVTNNLSNDDLRRCQCGRQLILTVNTSSDFGSITRADCVMMNDFASTICKQRILV